MEYFRGIVKFTLGAMVDLALDDETYSFFGDLQHYYENTVRGKMLPDEFEALALEVIKEKNVPKQSLR